MSTSIEPLIILCAEDDPDDQMLTRDALAEGGIVADLRFVCDGEQLLDYIHHRGVHSDPRLSPRPGIILMDLNMPRVDGREALQVIRSDPALRRLPIVVFTTSSAQADIEQVYDLGANSYVVKPASYAGMVRVLDEVRRYWSETVELPLAEGG